MTTDAQFPKQLFVKIEQERGESRFVVAGAPLYLTKTGETIKLGVYRLMEIGEAEGAVNYRSTRKVAK